MNVLQVSAQLNCYRITVSMIFIVTTTSYKYNEHIIHEVPLTISVQ